MPDQSIIFLTLHGVTVDRAQLEERFWSGVDIAEGCWLWKRSTTKSGYGKIFLAKVRTPNKPLRGVFIDTHRLSYILAHGPIPDGLIVRHKCNVKRCVRPDHLICGTYTQNADDAVRDGLRKPMRGEDSPRAILNDVQVLWARQQARRNVPLKDIAQQLSVSRPIVSQIIRGYAWAHLPGAITSSRKHSRRILDVLPHLREYLEDGKDIGEIAEHFGVRRTTICRWIVISNEV